jgi:hypothetical protein
MLKIHHFRVLQVLILTCRGPASATRSPAPKTRRGTASIPPPAPVKVRMTPTIKPSPTLINTMLALMNRLAVRYGTP